MAMSKEQRRKIYGIREPKDPADPEVLARRRLHEAVVRWELKWLNTIHAVTFMLSTSIILTPIFFKPWRAIIEAIPIISWIFREFASFGFWPILILVVGLVLHFYSMSKIDGKSYSEHGYPINLSHVGSPFEIIEAELYPRTRIEERIFWVDSAGGLLLAVFGWFIASGIVGFIFYTGGK